MRESRCLELVGFERLQETARIAYRRQRRMEMPRSCNQTAAVAPDEPGVACIPGRKSPSKDFRKLRDAGGVSIEHDMSCMGIPVTDRGVAFGRQIAHQERLSIPEDITRVIEGTGGPRMLLELEDHPTSIRDDRGEQGRSSGRRSGENRNPHWAWCGTDDDAAEDSGALSSSARLA